MRTSETLELMHRMADCPAPPPEITSRIWDMTRHATYLKRQVHKSSQCLHTPLRVYQTSVVAF